MKAGPLLKAVCVFATAIGLLVEGVPVQAGAPVPRSTSRPLAERQLPPAIDVALGAEGQLCGLLVDAQGIPLSQASVLIRHRQADVGVTTSDRLGQFAIQGLRGGTYELIVGQQVVFVRAWTSEAAPPHARPVALIVVSDQVVRGQLPLERFFSSDTFIITGLVAAAIAIPIAIHNSNSHTSQPHSP